VELEERVGVAGQGVVPPTGVPGPGDAPLAEAIADGRHGLAWDEPGRVGLALRVRAVDGVAGVDREAVRGDLAIPDQIAVLVELGADRVRSLGPAGRAGADQEDVV